MLYPTLPDPLLLAAIHNVEVSGQSAEYVQLDPFVNLNVSNPKDGHIHPEVKRRLYSAYAEADEAELSIAIPRQVPLVLNAESASRSEYIEILV